jgi:hypothetical protein
MTPLFSVDQWHFARGLGAHASMRVSVQERLTWVKPRLGFRTTTEQCHFGVKGKLLIRPPIRSLHTEKAKLSPGAERVLSSVFKIFRSKKRPGWACAASVQRRFLRRRSDWTHRKVQEMERLVWTLFGCPNRNYSTGGLTLCGSLCFVADTHSAGTAFKTICMHHE